MKTKIMALIATVGLATAAVAQDSDLFKENEFSLSLYGNYVDKEGPSKLAPGVGLNYFFTQKLGIGVSTFWENYEGTFIDNMCAEVMFRWPFDSIRLAPYATFGIGYSFETEEAFELIGAGVEFRFNEKWGIFGDLRWQFNNDTDNSVGVRVGARMVF